MSRSDPPAAVRQVIVVDDDPGIRTLFIAMLERKGFTVDVAPDGRAAYDQISRNAYSVILLDLMMPDVNGFELLEKLARECPSLLSRVIVMTGASRRVIQSLDTASIWGMIRKPFDIDELVSAVTACSDGRPRVPPPVSRAPKQLM
ncbi:MAG TPA: response regulator [Thermoanaerobaculia bacterium]|jgi:two-component system nitrogen regulation response regulator GlnG|nr:response regulator [Thermoanaerobaculia bacterium]